MQPVCLFPIHPVVFCVSWAWLDSSSNHCTFDGPVPSASSQALLLRRPARSSKFSHKSVPSFEARARPAALHRGPRPRAVLLCTARIAPCHPLPCGTAQHRAASHTLALHHRMLVYSEACRRMPVSADTCRCMLAHIGTCPFEPRHACAVPGGVHRAACRTVCRMLCRVAR